MIYRTGAAVILLAASPSFAQDPGGRPGTPEDGDSTIVVTAERRIIEALRGINPERQYEQADVAGYGRSTVGEILDEIQAENGDDEAIFLIDGEPVSGIDDIADFPAEAIERLEVLPRGSGQRIGREANRRIYNVVLVSQLRSLALAASREEATEGAWGQSQGEAIASRVAGRERLNLTLRARDSDPLTEADRNLVQPDPASISRPADFYEIVDGGAFRTLRSATRSYEASLVGGQPLAPWLTSSFSFLGRISRDRSLAGLPYYLFLLPGSSPFSPTGSDRTLVLFGPDPLSNQSERRTLNGNLTLNATRDSWIAGLTAQFALADRQYDNERLDSTLYPQPVTVPIGRNPFTDPLDDFFVTNLGVAESDERSWLLKLNVGGPVLQLPAGALRARLAAQRDGNRLHATNVTGTVTTDRTFSRSATRLDAGIDIPLASRRQGFLPVLGELSISLDRGYDAIDNLPNLNRSAISALWQPSDRLSISGSIAKSDDLAHIEQLADPVVIYDNVRVFDFLTGETVDVMAITGGNPALLPISKTTRRLSVNGAVWPKYNVQLNLDYEANILRDFVGAVPAASTAVFLAFPERFQRDAAGRLIVTDTRPVNFERQFREEVRYGLSFSVPVRSASRSGSGAAEGGPAAGSRTRFQVNAAHTIALQDQVVYRPGLPEVDLLRGGSLGLGITRPRHLFNGSVALNDPTYGVRLTGLYRSASTLQAGTATIPETLKFAPIFTASLRAFAELGPLLPEEKWLKDTRLSLTVNNIANQRQRVTASSGLVPLRFQPAYRDALGRTVEVELRRVF